MMAAERKTMTQIDGGASQGSAWKQTSTLIESCGA
jgi:hypothetical protein